jgi:hypothetical protein
MKVELADGRIAQIGVAYANRVPQRAFEMYKDKVDESFFERFRSTDIRLTVVHPTTKENITIMGSSYCNPNDRFIKQKARSKALKRLMQDTPYSILSKKDRALLCPIILHGHRVKE